MALSCIKKDLSRQKNIINALESEEKKLAVTATDIIDEAIAGFQYGYQLRRWASGNDTKAVQLRACISKLEEGSVEATKVAAFLEWSVHMAPQFYNED